MELFQRLHAALRSWPPSSRLLPPRGSEQKAVFAFYEAYFSNFIEGTEFEVEEAAEIIFAGRIPQTRPADAHDILCAFRMAIEPIESTQISESADAFTQGLALLRSLETPFQRAVFMMFMVTEIHPFTDGNGRTARLMMNAELSVTGEWRIIIPTV